MQIKRGIIFLHDWSVEFTFDRDERCKYEGMEEGKKMEQPDTRGNQNARRLVWLTRALDGRRSSKRVRGQEIASDNSVKQNGLRLAMLRVMSAREKEASSGV